MSLALEQPRLAPVQPWGWRRARDNFGPLRPSPAETTCSFPYRFSGKSRNSGLVPGKRDPNTKFRRSSFQRIFCLIPVPQLCQGQRDFMSSQKVARCFCPIGFSSFRKQVEHSFESTVSEERTYSVLRQTRRVQRKTWVSSLWHTNHRLRGTH